MSWLTATTTFSLYASWQAWPALLVTCANHGNEPLTVEVVNKLLADKEFLWSIKKGTIGFLLLNPEAYSQQKRFVDKNFNRVRNDTSEEGYEIGRREEIKEILHEHHFDYCIDLHTMSKPLGVIGICDKKHSDFIKQSLDVDQIRIDDVQGQGTFVGYFNTHSVDKEGTGIGLEMGQHKDHASIKAGIDAITNFLKYLWMVEWTPKKEKDFQGVYELTKEVRCHTINFKYAQSFDQLRKVQPNEVIGYDDGVEVKNDLEGEIYFWLATNTPIAGDGIGFLFRRVE